MRFVNLLIKPASSLCNLRCKYCFYEDEAENRDTRSMGVMREELAELLIRQAFETVDPDGVVSFAFQGGEPTIAGLPFFRSFTGMVRRLRPAGVNVQYAIQTNGTLLSAEWAAFFRQEGFLVGLSVDGVRTVHDLHRTGADGQGTWKQVLAAKALLEANRVEHNALCVVTGPCAEKPERVYQNLKRLNFRYLQFIACLDPINHARGQEPWSLTPEKYGDFLCRIFDLWYTDWKNGDYYSVRLFEDYVHILLGDGASTCATCGKCGAYFVIEGDGSVYPCDFYALDEWKLGNLQETSLARMAGCGKAREFLARGAAKPAECAACPYGRICNGGCGKDYFTTETGAHNYFCPAIRQLLGYALPRLQEIAAAEKAARDARTGKKGS